MRGKHLKSPEGGENALPKPHDRMEMSGKDRGKHGPSTRIASPPSAKAGLTHLGPTPDMKGRLFGHKRNEHGC
jgi:hypothetical protein